MNQTILALFALTLASMFALNARVLMHHGEQEFQRAEIDAVLAAVADETFDVLAELPFDGHTAATVAADLTPPDQFGGRPWLAAADLDDFDGAQTTLMRSTGSTAMPVTVTARVRYVHKAGSAFVDSGSRQLYKRVTLTLTGPLTASASLERVYALSGI